MPPLQNDFCSDFFNNSPSQSGTVIEIPGIQGLSGPPGPTGPTGPTGPSGPMGPQANFEEHLYYTKSDILLLFDEFKNCYRWKVSVVEEPDGFIETFSIHDDTFIEETLQVFVNGLLETNIEIVNDYQFIIKDTAPDIDDVIVVHYISKKQFNLLHLVISIPEVQVDSVE